MNTLLYLSSIPLPYGDLEKVYFNHRGHRVLTKFTEIKY
jgi:hypothetical protein